MACHRKGDIHVFPCYSWGSGICSFLEAIMAGRRAFIMGLATLGILGGTGVGVSRFLSGERFGALPDKGYDSPNWRDGRFHNLEPIDEDMVKIVPSVFRVLFADTPRMIPERDLPFARDDYTKMPDWSFAWLGHSTFLMKLAGVTVLTDPVFSSSVSPFGIGGKAFPGTAFTGKLPFVDLVLISHDHFDHLDHATISRLRGKIGQVFCPLGCEAHFARWGIQARAFDWWETANVGPLAVACVPARHFSGRNASMMKSLWCGWYLRAKDFSVLFSGDSGYGSHFRMIEERYGPVDCAFLDSGQYNMDWKEVNMFPAEARRAAKDLGARFWIPMHAGKFRLARHPWDEPFSQAGKGAVTPVMGEIVSFMSPVGKRWWKEQ